jgi:hypothetical protein
MSCCKCKLSALFNFAAIWGISGQMLWEAVKIGDSEARVLPMLQRQGSCRRVLQAYTKFDNTDYQSLRK